MSQNPTRYGFEDLQIINKETVYQGHFELQKITFRHKLFSGKMSSDVVRELLIKGEAAALIAYDPKLDNVVLIEQVRIGAYDSAQKKSPWLLELVAGMVDKGNERPAEVAIREAKEEAGLEVTDVQHALSVWDSPGGQLERLHLFLGLIDSTQVKSGEVHGLLEEENEDILVHVVSRSQAYQWVEDGTIDNVIAVIGLQWLQLNYQKFQ